VDPLVLQSPMSHTLGYDVFLVLVPVALLEVAILRDNGDGQIHTLHSTRILLAAS